jgi:hypothetical protein
MEPELWPLAPFPLRSELLFEQWDFLREFPREFLLAFLPD